MKNVSNIQNRRIQNTVKDLRLNFFFKNSWRPRVANYCDSSDSSNQGLHNTVCIVPQNFVLDV